MEVAADVAVALEGLELPDESVDFITAAHAALLRGRSDECVEALAALGPTPGPAVPYLLGLAHLHRGDPYRAGAAFEEAVSADPRLFRAQYALARVCEQREDFERGAEALRQALQVVPDHVGAIAALARAYTRLERLERAEALARRGLELDRSAPELLRALAEALRAQGRYTEAVEALRRALPRADADPGVHLALGRTLLDLERPDEARPIFEAVLQRDADSTDALAGIAEALEAEGRVAEAAGYVLRAMAAAPDRASLLILHARLSLASGRPEVAESSAVMAATLEPGSAEASRLAMRAASAQYRHADAAAYAETVLLEAPDDPEALAARAIALTLDRQPKEALALLRVVADFDASPEAALAWGSAALALGRADEAAGRFKEALRHLADDRLAQLLLGLAYRCAHDPGIDPRRPLVTILTRGEAPEEDDEDEPTAMVEQDVDEVRSPTDSLSNTGRAMTGPIAPIVEAQLRALLDDGPSELPARDSQPIEALPADPPSLAPGGAEEAEVDWSSVRFGDEDGLAEYAADASAPALVRDVGTPLPELATPSPSPSLLAPDSGEITPLPVAAPVEDVVGMLHRLQRILAGDPAFADLLGRVEGLVETHDQPLVLMVMGAPGAGKSTLVNALIGQRVIRGDTLVPHRVSYGRRPGGRVVRRDGTVESLALDALAAQLAERPPTPEEVARVEVLLPVEELARVTIVDAPDPFAEEAEVLVEGADALLWLGAARGGDAPWLAAEEWLRSSACPTIALITRTDEVSPEEVGAIRERVAGLLGGRVGAVVPVSAEQGLDGLRRRDVKTLRASGFARMHRALRNHLFSRAGLIREAAVGRRCAKVREEAARRVSERAARIGERADRVAALAERVAEDREAFRMQAEVEAPGRLEALLAEQLEASAQEFREMRGDNPGSFGRLHLLDALRSRVRRGLTEAVAAVRATLDERLAGLVGGYFETLDGIFPTRDDAAQAARIAGLAGIIDGFRLLLLEEAFGRHAAYLEGWVDQAPLEVLVEEGGVLAEPPEGADGSVDLVALVLELRERGLRMALARPLDLTGFGDAIFEGMVDFVQETADEQRVARVDLEKRLLEPLERLA